MKISVNENYGLTLEEVYTNILLVTRDGEEFDICMRDTGFEFKYNGVWYEAKNGEFKKLDMDKPNIPIDAVDLEVFHITDKHTAFIGYKISNGNFHFVEVPYNPRKNISKSKLKNE